MAERPVNLNKVRKARARAAAKQQADRNAVLHGLTGAEKKRARDEAARVERQWRGWVRDTDARDAEAREPKATVDPPKD